MVFNSGRVLRWYCMIVCGALLLLIFFRGVVLLGSNGLATCEVLRLSVWVTGIPKNGKKMSAADGSFFYACGKWSSMLNVQHKTPMIRKRAIRKAG